jgi:hypothetical protein
MRAFTLAVLAAVGLAAGPVMASAATMVESFTIPFGGVITAVYTTVPGFDPELGALEEASISVVGSTSWTPLSASSSLLINLSDSTRGVITTQKVDAQTTEPQALLVSLDDVSSGSDFLGAGLKIITLDWGSIPLPHAPIDEVSLDGTVTYTFTPTVPGAVPEPSTWAMMLLGFAGLGYARYRRASESRAAA